MKKLYKTYKDFLKLLALSRELSWTNNTIIFSRSKSHEEKEFYLNLQCKKNIAHEI